MNIWIIMLIGGLLTYLIRLSFIWLFARLAVPRFLRQSLRFVPPAVLSVIVFQELLLRDGRLVIGLENTRLLAGSLAILVAWRTRSPLLTILSGMAALLILNAALLGWK
jgi:branched-subunit amino acid transport protein